MKCGYCGEGGHSEPYCPTKKADEAEGVDTTPAPVETPKKTSKPKKDTSVGKVPTEFVWTAPPVASSAPTRPAVGSTLTDLQAMAAQKDRFPSTFAATMLAVGGYTVGDEVTLPGGQGTESETHEWKVSRGSLFFVVHTHPRAVMPTGATSGESNIHVKGSRGATHHESLNTASYVTLGILSATT